MPPKVKAQFGSSGLLRERLERGEPGGVYAYADLGNPLALAKAGKAAPVVLFARNRLCAAVWRGLQVALATALATMLTPDIKLGTSTPRNDPAGDYAWQLFAKSDQVQPGAGLALEAEALKLTRAGDSPRPRDSRNVYAWHVLEVVTTYSSPTGSPDGRLRRRRPASPSWRCRPSWPWRRSMG